MENNNKYDFKNLSEVSEAFNEFNDLFNDRIFRLHKELYHKTNIKKIELIEGGAGETYDADKLNEVITQLNTLLKNFGALSEAQRQEIENHINETTKG